MIRLGDAVAAAGRDNNVRVLRHVAALMVILFHCFALTDHWLEEPLSRLVPSSNLGLLGVQLFFALSGFLVTQSWLAHPNLRAFASARLLRIYPALIAATLFTFVVAGFSSILSWQQYLVHPQTWRYLWRTATAFDTTDTLPGAFMSNPFPRGVNGSLWTLPVELRLYLVVALAGLAGVLRRAWLALAIGIVAVALLVYVPYPVSLVIDDLVIRGLAIIFLCAALAYAWRAHIPLSIPIALVMAALYATMPPSLLRAVAILPMLVYVVLVLAYHPRLRMARLARGSDWSYGLYVYAFPIQQTLARVFTGIDPWPMFAMAVPLTAAMAALSWRYVEAPALALKSRFRTRGAPA